MTSDASSLFSVEGKRVLVTGGSVGIGRMIVEGFARAGATVDLSSRKAEACAAVVRDLSGVGIVRALPADLSTEAGCRAAVAALAEHESVLDVLVNNAGTIRIVPLGEHDDSIWDRMLSLNLKAAFHLSRLLLPMLTAGRSADDPSHIINVGSMDVLRVAPMESYAYSASKAALHHLTRQLAWRLAPLVTVNTIVPGTFPSRMSEPFLRGREDGVAASVPLGADRPSE